MQVQSLLRYGARAAQLWFGGCIEVWRCGIYIAYRGNQLDNIYDEPLCARQLCADIYFKIHPIWTCYAAPLRCNWFIFLDVDECATGRASCPRFRQCVNTFGSYICKCHKGFDLMYIAGKYQCHGNEPWPSFCFVLFSFFLVVQKVLLTRVVTGMSEKGEGNRHYIKQRSSSTTGSLGCTCALFLPFICWFYTDLSKKSYLETLQSFDAIILLSQINSFFSHFLMQI